MLQPTSVTTTPFGRHVAILSLSGPCSGAGVCEELVAQATRAVESDRTGLVVDLRDATGLGADVLETIRDIDRAGHRCGWRLVVVRPFSGPLRTLFFSEALDLGLTLSSSRAHALLWAMRVHPASAQAAS
jgi:hypothetical protein